MLILVFCNLYMNMYPIIIIIIIKKTQITHTMVSFLWGNTLLVFLGNEESLNPYVELHPEVPAALHYHHAHLLYNPLPIPALGDCLKRAASLCPSQSSCSPAA